MRKLWNWVPLAAVLAVLLALAIWQAQLYTTEGQPLSESDSTGSLAVPPPPAVDSRLDDELFWRGF